MANLNAWHFDTGLIDASTPDELRGFRDNGRYEVIQFTGLKDKNGKEIYEGDIVKGEKWGRIYEVRYDDEYGGFHPFVECDFEATSYYDHPLEVIGNIYENSELLKA